MHRNIHCALLYIEASKTKIDLTVHYERQPCCGGKSPVSLALRYMMKLDVHAPDS